LSTSGLLMTSTAGVLNRVHASIARARGNQSQAEKRFLFTTVSRQLGPGDVRVDGRSHLMPVDYTRNHQDLSFKKKNEVEKKKGRKITSC